MVRAEPENEGEGNGGVAVNWGFTAFKMRTNSRSFRDMMFLLALLILVIYCGFMYGDKELISSVLGVTGVGSGSLTSENRCSAHEALFD